MHVRKLTAWILRVTLRKPFRHASHQRHYSDNIVVRAELADGTEGWGEGVPREYVTGETAEGAFEQFAATAWGDQLAGDAACWSDVLALCERIAPAAMLDDSRGCHGNSVRCAVELSLLDAFGKLFGEPVSRGLEVAMPSDLVDRSQRVRYSTTIDAEHARRIRKTALKMRIFGFQQCKVKVGKDNPSDAQRLKIVRRWIGRGVDLRLDANEAWRPEQLIDYAGRLSAVGITCIEQPLPHEDLAALGELRPHLNVPVMLDESLCSTADARRAIELSACDLFNLRVSKCGGLINCLRLAEIARQHGLGYQLGCHPGESGLLSAAGRHLAVTLGGIRYLEGSYDRHLLREVPTTPDLTFGYGGWAPRLAGPGLGAVLDRAVTSDSLRLERSITLDA